MMSVIMSLSQIQEVQNLPLPGKQDAVELSELTQNPDPSTSIQIMDSTDQLSMTVVAPGTSTTYQDQLNQSIPQGQQVQQEVIVVQNSRQSAACSGVVMKTESHGGNQKKKKAGGVMKFRFDQNGHLIKSGSAADLPDDVIETLEKNHQRQLAEGEGKSTSCGIQYDKLVDELEEYRDKDMQVQTVNDLRRLAPRYRKAVYLSPSELKNKEKIKFLWSTLPKDWPAQLKHLHADPNNPGKNAEGVALPKPKKKDLVRLLQYFQSLYEERRGVILQHYNEVKSKNVDMAACNQEPSSSAPERIMELDSAHPTSSVEHLVNDLSPCQLVEAVLSHCVEQEEARSLLQKLYERFWNSTETCSDGQALLDQTQMKIRKFLTQVFIRASESQVSVKYMDLRAPLEKINNDHFEKVEKMKSQMATSIPLPVINMAEQLPLPSGSSDQIIIAQPTVTQAASMQFELSDTDDNNQWPPEAPVQAVTSAGMTTMMEVNDLESFEQPTFVQELQTMNYSDQVVGSNWIDQPGSVPPANILEDDAEDENMDVF